MQFRLYGKIVNRSSRRAKKSDGTDYTLYSLVIEEPGLYPSRFQVSSKDASLFGQPDGQFGIGKFATVTGFQNGREYEATRQDGTKFKSYRTYYTIRTLESAAPAEPTAPAPAAASAKDGIDEDIPF